MQHFSFWRVISVYTSAGHVYTPRDGLLWTISKAELHISDIFYGANVEHLLKTHIKMEPICISMHRHLSILHPLHQILQYHCRGLIPVNAFGLESLISNNNTYRSLFSHGNEGASELLIKEYRNMVWDDVDLERNIQVFTNSCEIYMTQISVAQSFLPVRSSDRLTALWMHIHKSPSN